MTRNIYLFISIIFILFISCKKKETESSVYITKPQVSIFKDSNTKKGFLIFAENINNWKLLSNNQSLILEGSNKINDTLYIPDSEKSYDIYSLITSRDTMQIAEVLLPMEGGFNFRDLGGIETQNGRYLKWGRIIRSDDLSGLTTEDLNYLSTMPLITIIDFRSQEEINAGPDKLPASVKIHDLLCINPGNVLDFVKADNIDSISAFQAMQTLNIALVTDSTSIEQYKKFFDLLSNYQNTPLLFHCSAGKDRTGMGAALVLFALGVSEDVVYENYLKSNSFLRDKYKAIEEKNPNLKPFFVVKKEYLEAGLNEIKSKYGSIDNYLVNTLKVDTLEFRKNFLQ